MGDKTRGLHGKFNVSRTDGKSLPGQKHHGCDYFVLDLSCDLHALPALIAYCDSLRLEGQYPLLLADLEKKIEALQNRVKDGTG